MHGTAITSLLIGTECCVAPDARAYYVAVDVGFAKDGKTTAAGLYWIIDQNKKLAEGQKIQVVSISDDEGEVGKNPHPEAYIEAREAAENAGILVVDAASFVWSAYYDYGNDPEDVRSYNARYPVMAPQEGSPEKIVSPASLRTMAEHYIEDSLSYAYYGDGGVIWAVPYVAGVAALGWQINPSLDKDEIVKLLFQTAYVNSDGAKIINPVAFISAVKET